MKNLLVSALIVGALTCPVVYAEDVVSPAVEPGMAEVKAPAVEPKPATQNGAKKNKRHQKAKKHKAKKKCAKHSKKKQRAEKNMSESAVEKKIEQETELNNH